MSRTTHITPTTTSNDSTLVKAIQEGFLVGSLLTCGIGAIGYYGYQWYKRATNRYTLTYFNVKALGETSRLLFVLAGVKYEDKRFEFIPSPTGPASPAFLAVKETLPFGQVPILEYNGIVLAQSRAIERFLARQFGFMGCDEVEAQLIDSVVETLNDLRHAWRNSKTDEEKAKFWTTNVATAMRYLNRFALTHSKSGQKTGRANHFVGNSISYCDVAFYYWLSIFDDQQTVSNAIAPYPSLIAIRQIVGDHPRIKEWVAIRPKTAM